MKLLIYTDPHFCERSSIINKVGTKYTLRLENQIASINWAEDLAYKRGCQYVICAGDFFDKPNLTQQELTALTDIKWAPLCAHYFLVGNHESEENDLHYNSTQALRDDHKDTFIISEPHVFDEGSFELAFLPYIVESNKRPLKDYFPPLGEKPRILISHNDILGIQLGPVVSTVGFSTDELEQYCTCCFNGHLHNGQKASSRVLNLGNLTGKDFGEDAYRYPHRVAIVDTDTFKVEFVENPYAFNFYKIEINEDSDLAKLKGLKPNAVVQVKCWARYAEQVRKIISDNTEGTIIESRIIIMHELNGDVTECDITDLTVDQYAKFMEFCKAKLEQSQILDEELAEILK